MQTTLLLVRHGETVDNANQLMQGQTQGRLNVKGISQAFALRDQMATEHIDAIVASDLKRAIDTATIVAAPHRLLVVTTPLLRERDDIESMPDLLARAGRFLDFIRREYPGKTVLAVGHGIVNKAIQAVFYGKPMNEVARMANCEVRRLSVGTEST